MPGRPSKAQERLRVLIVEDHEDIAANIGDFLSLRGHRPDYAHSGNGALNLVLCEEFDVVILDIMLPGMDGLTFCRKMREEARLDTPILMLSARDTVPDKLSGFEVGADDYMTKPFSLEELEARLLALARRAHGLNGQTLKVGNLTLDIRARRVQRAGDELSLNHASFMILTELMRVSPGVVSRGRLETLLWGDEPPPSDSLRSQIYLLRRSIDRPYKHPMLETVHGVGYRLAAPDA